MRRISWSARACLALVVSGAFFAHGHRTAFAADGPTEMPPSCDRQCLYGFLDLYLNALKAKDPSRLPLAKGFRYSENNVMMKIGDGVWGTTTGLGDYNLRMADTTNGQVGFYGIVDETTSTSVFALRLKVADNKISEAETLIRRSDGSGPFPTKPVMVDKPVLNEIVPAEARRPRERMIAIVDGYFSTLQLNDGVLFTQFDENCNRIENGLQTTHNPDLVKIIPVANLGCAQQFKLGNYRYDDRVRDRRFFLVDEERGLVMAAGFIDHAGRLENFTLTDGTPIKSPMRTPSTLCLLELFKIRDGKIQQIEAVFIGVPYNMGSPWIQYPSN
ncbi:MAG TPA: hypothetical protein VEJ45_12110 [Candidatus Acidoferrales bacterium]|nr:hypothetical protein [Candidatus Acidoferrales bacterium]